MDKSWFVLPQRQLHRTRVLWHYAPVVNVIANDGNKGARVFVPAEYTSKLMFPKMVAYFCKRMSDEEKSFITLTPGSRWRRDRRTVLPLLYCCPPSCNSRPNLNQKGYVSLGHLVNYHFAFVAPRHSA